MAASFIQSVNVAGASNSQVVLAYPGPNTAGNLLVACAGFPTVSTPTISSFTDQLGNKWIPVTSWTGNGVNSSWYCYCCLSALTGIATVTVNGSFTNANSSLQLWEFSDTTTRGIWVVGPETANGDGTGITASANSGNINPIITNTSNSVLIGTCSTQAASVTAGSGGGWVGSQCANVQCWQEYQITTSASAIASTFTVASVVDWACGIMSFYTTPSATMIYSDGFGIHRASLYNPITGQISF